MQQCVLVCLQHTCWCVRVPRWCAMICGWFCCLWRHSKSTKQAIVGCRASIQQTVISLFQTVLCGVPTVRACVTPSSTCNQMYSELTATPCKPTAKSHMFGPNHCHCLFMQRPPGSGCSCGKLLPHLVQPLSSHPAHTDTPSAAAALHFQPLPIPSQTQPVSQHGAAGTQDICHTRSPGQTGS